MKDKKGITKEEILRIIIAAVSILILVYLAFKLYKIISGSKEKEQAEAILKQVGERINTLKASDIMLLTGPKGWFLYMKDETKLCVFCEKTSGCPKELLKDKTISCISINPGLSVQIKETNKNIPIYITTLKLEKENEKIFLSIKK